MPVLHIFEVQAFFVLGGIVLKKTALILLICLLISALFCSCGKKGNTGEENYEIGPDVYPSVNFVLGDREIVSKEEKDGIFKYTYKTEEEGYMDVYEYMSYLIDNCGGVVTVALNEGEKGQCEIAMESDESGYVVTMGFDYSEDEYTVTIKRLAGKIKKN